MQEISERKRTDARMEKLAFYDPLTELPNRSYFLDQLEQKLQLALTNGNRLTLLLIDLDFFKEINDTRGHLTGDKVLIEVARRFRGVSRRNEIIARLGGDEFVMISENVERDGAEAIASRLLGVFRFPINVNCESFHLGASIGIAIHSGEAISALEMIRQADIAMYRAKESGGGYWIYGDELGEKVNRRSDLFRRFNHALSAGNLQLHYQPKVSLRDGALTGAEALLRWHDSDLGWIPPADLLPLLEERGMMPRLGEWVLARACQQIRAWKEAGLALPPRLAWNVSVQEFEAKNFVERTLSIIEQHGVSPANLEVEITESSMMRDPEFAIATARALLDAGVELSIDDFGTGYSSLAYIHKLPVNTLKIDRSFTRNLVSEDVKGIIHVIIEMANRLGLRSLAEGVENAVQVEALRVMGCVEAQGFHFGRPIPPDEFGKIWLGQPPEPSQF